jgi:hypothetical protein
LLDAIEQIGSIAGLAAFLGLGVLALLSFTQARDIRRLRDWAGSAPERDADRKESTSTIAAQRAEELRALEEARTAEHAAVSQREQRRRRREEGLPEMTRRERIGEGFSSFGERLAEPRWLVVLFIVVVVVAGGVGYAVLSGSDDAPKNGNSRQAAVRIQPSDIEVAVLNGTAVAGLAATYGDKVKRKDFKLGAVTNTSQPIEASVVMYTRGHKTEAKKVARQLGISDTQLMSQEIETAAEGANVAVIVGEDNATEAG